MNLEELQIKIGIELKELNKQLKKASDDINDILGPKATKKMMSDNNKVIKDGFKVMEKTTKTSAKQINKDLNDAFDIDKTLVKFNKSIDHSMEQAKISVRNACNDIRRELNSALNINTNIKVNASASMSGQNASSRAGTAAMITSNQHAAAMMVKAINGMIDTDNKNTGRLEGAINKSTNKLVSAISKQQNKSSKVENKVEVKAPEVKVNVPEIKVPEVTVNVPETESKAPEVTIEIPEIKIPDIKIDLSQLDESINKLGDKLASAISSLEDVIKSNNRQDKPVQVDTVKKPVVTKQQGGNQTASTNLKPSVFNPPKQQPKVFRTSPSADDDYTRKVARKAIDDTYFDDIDKVFQSIIETISVLSTPLNPKKMISSIVSQVALESIAENIKVSPGQQNSLIYGDIAKLEAQKEQLKNKRDGIIGGNGVDISKINTSLYKDIFDKEIEQIDKAISELRKSLNPIDLKIPNPDELGAKELEEITARTKESVAKFNQAIEEQTKAAQEQLRKIQQQIKQSQIDFNAKNNPINKPNTTTATINKPTSTTGIAQEPDATGGSEKDDRVARVLAKYKKIAEEVESELKDIVKGLNEMEGEPDTDELDKYYEALMKIREQVGKIMMAPDPSKIKNDGIRKVVTDLQHYKDIIKDLERHIGTLKFVNGGTSLSKGSKGLLNATQLANIEKRLNDPNKPNISNSNNNSLGFLPYKQQLNDLAETAKNVGAKIKNIFGNIGSEIKGIFKGTGTNLFGDFGKSFDSHIAVQKVGEIKEHLNEVKKNYKNTIKSINEITNKLTTPFKKIASGLKGVASTTKSAWSKITSIFRKGAKDCEASVSSLKGSMGGLGSSLRSLVGMFGLYRFGSIFVDATKQAMSYEASLMTIKRTLGGASKVLEDFANTNAKAFGLSKIQTMQFANIYSVFVSEFASSAEQNAKITTELLKAAGTIASATGYDLQYVLEGLRSGIMGSTQAIDQFGLSVKVGHLETTELFKKIANGRKSFNDLTAAEQRLIITQEILNQVTEKYGTVAKNTNSMHNAFMAQVSNTKLALGQLGKALYTAVLPALTSIMAALEKVFTYAANVVTSILSLFGITVDFASNMEDASGSLDSSLGDSVDDTTDSLEEATEAAEKFKGSLMGFDEINVLTDNTSKDAGSGGGSAGDLSGLGGEIATPEMSESESVFDKLSDKMKAFLDEVLEPFKNAWALLGDRWKEEWADLIESFKNFCTSLATFLKSVWDHGGKEFVQHMAEIGLACGIAAMEIGGEILDSLAKLWQHLDPSTNMNTQGFLDALNEVSVKVRDFVLGLGDHFESLMANGGQDVLNAFGDMFMNLGEAAVRGLGVAIDALDGFIDHLDPAINENTRNMLQSLADMLHATGQTALDFVSLLESALGNGGQDMINAFGDMLMNLGDTAASVITTMMESFSAFFDYIDPAKNDITKAMMKAWEEAFLAIGDMALGFADLFDSVMANGGQEVLNKLGDAFNSLLGLVGTVVKEIADALNGLFEHLDPKTNEFTQGMLKAWQDAFDGISDMAKDIGKVLSSAMDNGGQDLVNAIGDLAMKVSGAFGKVVDTVAECVGNLFKHLDPAENDIAKGAIKSFEYFIDSIGDFVDSLAKSLKTFMDNGGQEFVNNVADIILLIGDLAFTIGGDILSAISKFMDSWLGHAVISTCATALELVSEVLKGLLEILEPLSPLISGVVAAFAGFQVASKVVGFITSIVTAFQALGGAGGILALIKGGFTALWAVIAANPIAATVAAIAAIGVALVALYNKCEGFRDFIDGILKGFSGLFEAIKKHFGTLLEDVKNIFGNVIDIIVGIFTGDGEKVGTAVRELIGNILKLFGDLVVALFDIGVNLIEGLVKGIWECIKSIPKLLAGIGDFIVGFFKGLFGIHSPSTVFAELGTFLMEGLIEGILSSEGSIANAFVKISKTIIEGTKDIVKDVSDKFKEMKETIKEKLDEAKEVVSEKWKDIKQTVSEKAKEIYDNTKEKWSSVKETISEKAKESYQIAKENWANIKQTVSEKTKETYNSIKENWANVKQTAVNIFTGTYEATKENWSNIKDTIADKTKSAYEAAKDKWADIKQVTTDRFKESYETVKDRFTNIKDAVKEKATKTYEDVSNAWTKIKDDAGKKLEQIRTDAEKKYNDVKTTLVTKIGEAKDGIVSKWEEVRTKTNECIENVKTTAESSYENVKQTIAKKLDEVKSNTSSKWEEIKKNTGDAVERVRQEAENKYNAVKNSMVSTLENARKEMLTKWDAIKSEAITRATEAAENASTKFADIKTKISSKMDEVKSTLDTKWEKIKSQTSTKASDVAKKAESAFSNIGSKASSALESARTSISNGLSKITSLFRNTSWSLPKIKLPHFKITGSFSLNPPSVPKFGVEWYKRGGIIDGITPLGFTGGTMHMGGEAGKEMVVPLENTSFTSKIAQAMGQAVDNAMARNYNNMSNNNNNNNSENRDVVLQLDGREFARASINSINKLQRESGRTLLDI